MKKCVISDPKIAIGCWSHSLAQPAGSPYIRRGQRTRVSRRKWWRCGVGPSQAPRPLLSQDNVSLTRVVPLNYGRRLSCGYFTIALSLCCPSSYVLSVFVVFAQVFRRLDTYLLFVEVSEKIWFSDRLLIF